MKGILDPSASDDLIVQADWLELRALKSKGNTSSIEDLVQVLQRAGTAEEVEEDSRMSNSEKCQIIAEDAFSELEDRFNSCGDSSEKYAFKIDERTIQLQSTFKKSVYVFLLLLSKYGKDAGPKGSDGSMLFEKICVEVASNYFGGGKQVEKYHFGAPRKGRVGFKDAVNDLCKKMGEGVGCNEQAPRISYQKDSKLDLIVWRPFLDGRLGKLIGFGQCATGDNWNSKLTELLPSAFVGLWMKEALPITPMRLFFVPFRIGRDLWKTSVLHGGILFDRCRIVEHAGSISPALRKECNVWATYVLKKRLGVKF